MATASRNFVRALRAAVVAMVMAGATPARADDAAPDARTRSLAESLFRDGKALLEAGKYAEACPKLEESQRLDPGGGTLLNVALCHERMGRVASAWAEYREALAIARRDGREDRASLAVERIAAIEPTVPWLRVVVAEDAPGDLAVSVDGRALPRAAWGTAAAIDPGGHDVVASRGSIEFHRAHVQTDVGSGTTSVEIPRAPEAPPVEVSPKDERPIPPRLEVTKRAAPTTEPAPESGPEPQRIVGIVMTTLGAATAAVGGGAGIAAIVKHSESDDLCLNGCTKEGKALEDEAFTASVVSTAGFAVGLPLAAAGILVWVTAPSDPGDPGASAAQVVSWSPWVGPGGFGVVVAGRFD